MKIVICDIVGIYTKCYVQNLLLSKIYIKRIEFFMNMNKVYLMLNQ